jgi:3',5'-cyclic AMP phosphodiesterase CpdA
MSTSVGILHISDIHFTPEGQPGYLDNKALQDLPSDDAAEAFLQSSIPAVVESRKKEGLPPLKAIIVNGDLIQRRQAMSGRDVNRAFKQACEFLERLAATLDIERKKVFVVPGNHDVEWTTSTNSKRRFARYLKHMEPFTTPAFLDGNPEPLVVQLSDFDPDVPGQLLFLVSPTLAGLEGRGKEIIREHLGQQAEKGVIPRDAIEGLVQSVARQYDIAFIGEHQLKRMRSKIGAKDKEIRIAILHHHLLPDDNVEIKEFEAVIDAGKVLAALMQLQFDLVLTGHKHNARMLHYRHSKEQGIDVFCAPSLFCGYKNAPSGFTILDIHGPKNPCYVTLHHYLTKDGSPYHDPPVRQLWRHTAAFGKTVREFWKLLEEQQQRVRCSVEFIVKAFQWDGGPHAGQGFKRAWEQIEADIERLAAQQIVLRDPGLHSKWKETFQHWDQTTKPDQNKELRIVSFNDLDFWLDEKGYFRKYTEPLNTYAGKKWRILILPESQSHDRGGDIRKAIEKMYYEHRFQVSVVWLEALDYPSRRDYDFGLMGELGVWTFENFQTKKKPERVAVFDTSRAVIIDFRTEELRRRRNVWEMLTTEPGLEFFRSGQPPGKLEAGEPVALELPKDL